MSYNVEAAIPVVAVLIGDDGNDKDIGPCRVKISRCIFIWDNDGKFLFTYGKS